MFEFLIDWFTKMPKKPEYTYGLILGTKEQFDTLTEQVRQLYNMSIVTDRHLHTLLERTNQMALDLTVLTDEVARLETVEAGAVTLIHTLLDEVVALKDDPAALEALVARIKASDDLLAGAVAAGTPAAPAV